MSEFQMPGPLPVTHAAKFRPPPNSCDCHAHVVGPFAKFPMQGNRPTSEQPLEAYLRMHEILGFDRGILTQPSTHGIDNSALLDALSRTHGTVKGIVAMDAAELTDAEVARLEALGVRGVRISWLAPVGPKLDDLEAVAERIKSAGWILEVIPPDSMEPLVALRSRLEKLPVGVMFDQMGCPKISEGVEGKTFQAFLSLLRDGLAWVKLSHPYHLSTYPYADVLPFAQALVKANPERCVFGTDWPHPRGQAMKAVPDDGFLVDLFAQWVPDKATQDLILVQNPAKIYRF